jgi:tripartite-type tricarboxylate transporter receptor subunit TctC
LAAGAAALPAVSRIAWAQTYPTRPVRLIVGFAAAGGSDVSARLLGQWLSERLGQPFVVENRPGAGSSIATEAVVNAPPDGYTLLVVTVSNAIHATFYENLNYNFIRDITPIASFITGPEVLEVNPSVPAKTLREFIAYANANPGKLNIASSGIGTGTHLSGELLKMMTGVNIVHVPYRSTGPALTDLLGGQVHATFTGLFESIAFVRSGALRALGVGSTNRSAALPDVPAISEFFPGYEATVWYGIGAPKNTPREIVEKLNREINIGLADPRIKSRIADLGGTPLPGSPADFGKLIADETEKWGKVVRAAHIKAQ